MKSKFAAPSIPAQEESGIKSCNSIELPTNKWGELRGKAMKSKTITSNSSIALILLFAMNCSSNDGPSKPIQVNSLDRHNRRSLSTAYTFPNIQIPRNFYLDSIIVYDTVSRAKYSACFIQSKQPEMKQFNQIVSQLIKDQILAEQKSVDPYDEDDPVDTAYHYRLKPVDIYSNDQIISIYNIIDTYANGGNHHNYTMHTINYDLSANKRIKFNDVFRLHNRKDSADFIEFSEEYTSNNECSQWSWPDKEVDFSFSDNGIYINPNVSWACVLTRYLLPITTANKFVRKKWARQKLLKENLKKY